ncbi:hypothetical protein OXYTRIMIC_627 [Oxytricha trifallax]|uniref:Uncharacterized protein n=1 Tax=Oxytricha trifallax TaxID=1172189 RepID=A0A073HX98_9SPIT|nr:hypothetical protein OXYTRIMIC_627 [Oxytricha trifallax]
MVIRQPFNNQEEFGFLGHTAHTLAKLRLMQFWQSPSLLINHNSHSRQLHQGMPSLSREERPEWRCYHLGGSSAPEHWPQKIAISAPGDQAMGTEWHWAPTIRQAGRYSATPRVWKGVLGHRDFVMSRQWLLDQGDAQDLNIL